MIKTLTLAFIAAATIALSFAIALDSAAALSLVAKKTLIDSKSLPLQLQGRDDGASVGYPFCGSVRGLLPGTCGVTMPLKQII